MENGLPADLREDIYRRLQRLEGQARGVRRMLDEGRDCDDILTQLAAIRGAAQQISLLLVENYARFCLSTPTNPETTDETIARLVNTLGKLS